MPPGEYKHVRLKRDDEIMLVELTCSDVQGPERSQEFCAELLEIASRQWGKPLLLNVNRVCYFSSMGLAALFRMVKQAKEHERPVKICNMHPDVRTVAEVIGLNKVVEIYDSEELAIKAFASV